MRLCHGQVLPFETDRQCDCLIALLHLDVCTILQELTQSESIVKCWQAPQVRYQSTGKYSSKSPVLAKNAYVSAGCGLIL